MAKWIGLILYIIIWAGYDWSIEGCIIATLVAFGVASVIQFFEKKKKNREFFEYSETTCHRCNTTVRAYSRIGGKAFYTCPNCGRSFVVYLYDPD